MLKSAIVASAFALALIQPAFSQEAMKSDMKCDDATMMKMTTDMDAMKDDSMKMQKDEAMKEMDMAKEAMKADKTDECMMHMDNAMKAMEKKG